MTKPHSSGNCLATPRIAKTRRKERPSRGVETQKERAGPAVGGFGAVARRG